MIILCCSIYLLSIPIVYHIFYQTSTATDYVGEFLGDPRNINREFDACMKTTFYNLFVAVMFPIIVLFIRG